MVRYEVDFRGGLVLMNLLENVGLPFFTALGVVLGGCLVGSLSALFTFNSPFHTMLIIAKPIKLWAILTAMGGSLSAIQAIDTSVWSGEVRLLLHQLVVILSSFFGASVGYWIILTLAGSE